MTNTCFTCIGKSHGAPAIPATREAWEKLRNEKWLAHMCRRIVAGEEKLKGKLPIWTPACVEFKGNHRAVKDVLKPLPRLMLDFDEKGHSKEILEKSLRLHKEGRWEILLVEESVRKGTHVLITLPQGMTPQEAQQRFSEDVGFTADPALKDVARCIYMVPAEHTLFVNEALFSPVDVDKFRHGFHGLHGSRPLPNEVCDHQPEATETQRYENPCNPCNPCQKEYAGIPYTEIIETLEEQMGGKPDVGSRNNFIFSMACHLRYICNDDPEWIAQVLPTYGEEKEKFIATVKSACQRIQTKQMPRIIKRTLAICKRNSELITQSEADSQVPPEMPKNLPPLIRLLVSRTPEIYRPAVAHAVFPSLGAHLYNTRFRYIDNCYHEATLATLLMAGTGSGKSSVNTPIDYIMADIRKRDELNMEKERNWKRDTQSKGANKDKKQRPEGIVIQCIDADITSAAFVQRMADAEGRFLYARMNEIEQLYNLSSRGNSHNVFDLLCFCFDYGNLYGQTRISAASVSEKVTVRFNYNVSTTIRKGQHFFRNVLTDGPLSRINICTIPERPIGSEMPVYGTYDDTFAEELKPYIERLNAARGLVECPEASALSRRLVEECADFARLSQSRVYENFSFRGNVIAFLKAMVLYVAHGEVWTEEMEDFVRWSLQYDLWCKMRFFGEAIEAQEEGGLKLPAKGPQNLLDQLPEVFTREEAGLMRQRMGIRSGSLRQMLGNWTYRGYIELYGEELPKQDLNRQRYIKTEEYLRKHPQR
ncbi:MAG: VirE protein [Bacteroidaceae bacterium]|nr:VirE protein [Bacteroidaceae bacterium]